MERREQYRIFALGPVLGVDAEVVLPRHPRLLFRVRGIFLIELFRVLPTIIRRIRREARDSRRIRVRALLGEREVGELLLRLL